MNTSYQHVKVSKEGKYDHRILLCELFPIAAAILLCHHYLFQLNMLRAAMVVYAKNGDLTRTRTVKDWYFEKSISCKKIN